MNLELDYNLPTEEKLEERYVDYDTTETIVDCHTIEVGNGFTLYCDITLNGYFEDDFLRYIDYVEVRPLQWYFLDEEIDKPLNERCLLESIENEIKNFYK